MKKEVAKKKINYALRKRIRRTTATILLLTSIVIASIPVPDIAAVETTDTETSTTTTSVDPITYLSGIELENEMKADSGFPTMSEAGSTKTIYTTYEIQTLSDGSYQLIEVFQMYQLNNSGVICGFNSGYVPENSTLVIPNNVITEYVRFTQEDVNTHMSELGSDKEVEVNSFFGISQTTDDDGAQIYDVAHYEFDSTNKVWRMSDTQLEMTDENKAIYYMDSELDCKKADGYEAREVIVQSGDGANQREYIPYSSSKGWKYKDDYNVNAISDEAFWNGTTSSANHIQNLELQIEDTIVAIGDRAFQGATTLKSITIGSAVKEIGDQAFKGCTGLEEVTIRPGNTHIGIESFANCNSLTAITFPSTLLSIGIGAFANSSKLASVDMTAATGDDIAIGAFAFYGCPELSSVALAPRTGSIGDGCFAVLNPQPTTGMTEFMFPQESNFLTELGIHMFDGQAYLKTVTMPIYFGNKDGEGIDEGFFRGCTSLEKVIFSDLAIYANFPANAFVDASDQLIVCGPPYISSGVYATPRECAHAANVPYQYVENGVTYLELKKGDNFYRINDQSQLISFESESDEINLEILDKIGNFPITGIATDCFDEDTKAKLKTVTIYDNSISLIADNTFSNCDNLTEVYIGNSVQTIGASAFANCKILEDVTIGEGVTTIGNSAFYNCPEITRIEFISPTADYSAMVIGTDAFTTKSDELVLVGDISSDYAPFQWAMSEDSVLDDMSGKRVCYQSPAPSNLTVLYDNNTGLATLVDYPHFENIDTDNEDYKKDLILYYQDLVDQDDSLDDAAKEASKTTIENVISDPNYIENKIRTSLGESTIESVNWNPEEGGDYYQVTLEEQAFYNSICNVVIPSGIESIDVRRYAADVFNTGVTNNKSNFSYITSGKLEEYRADPESTSLASVYEGYVTLLGMNTLVASSSSTYTVVQDVYANVPGGLFSGNFLDYTGNVENEKTLRGNDRLTSVTMTDVQALPDYAFAGCENLETVILGSELKQMGIAPFLGATDLMNVSSNDYFTVENKIVYAKDQTGTSDALTLVQCLPSRGLTSGAEKEVSTLTDPLLANVSTLYEAAFIDCDGIGTVDLSDSTSLTTIPTNTFYDSGVTTVKLPTSTGIIKTGAFKTESYVTVTIPTKSTSIESDAFNTGKIITYADTPAYNYALEDNDLAVGTLGELYEVTFMGYQGEIIEVQEVESGNNAYPPTVTPPSGYVFKEWNGDYMNVTENRIITAIFQTESEANGGTSSDGTDSDSDSDSDDTTSENSTEAVYQVTVVSGSGSGEYNAGDIVNITANASSTGLLFDKWTTATSGVYMSNVDDVTTSFVMPKTDVTITANYKTSTGESVTPDDSDEDDDSDSTTSSTIVTITKPGFSDEDKANAYVNGSADNFVVKITESAVAQELLQSAFLKKMDTLDTLKFFPMDISLYDSTGTVLVTDSAGISITITLPIPDELRQYAGNNRVASEYNGVIEELEAKFTTIDGVPCVTFVATHFSPYAIYVDTANLGSGTTQDSTPQTGDGIHPKWFLSIGFLASAIFLYMKKDKQGVVGEIPYETA